MKGFNRTHLIAASIIAASVIIGVSPVLADELLTEKRWVSYNTSADVSNKTDNAYVGVNTGRELAFGNVSQGLKVTKAVRVAAIPNSRTEVEVTGNISPHIYILPGYEGDEEVYGVRFNATELGYYEGKVKIKSRTPNNRWGEKWLQLKSSLLSFSG